MRLKRMSRIARTGPVVIAVAIGSALIGCAGGAPSVPVTSNTVAPTLAPSPPPTPTPEPTPKPVEVARWSHVEGEFSSSVYVELRNPNDGAGLVRSRFSLSLVADDGSVISVEGGAGVPGSRASTIYQLPPRGTYGISAALSAGDLPVAGVEFVAIDEFYEWSTLEPAIATIEGPRLTVESGFATVTGRVAVDQPDTYNVIVQAFVEEGDAFTILEDVVECVKGGAQPRAFELVGEPPMPRGSKLTKLVAYVTTVRGAGGVETPPGC